MDEEDEEEESEEDLMAAAVLVGELGCVAPPFELVTTTRLDEVDLLKLELFELTDMDRDELLLAMLSEGTVLLVFKLLLLVPAVVSLAPLLTAGGRTAPDVLPRSLRPRTMCRKLDGLFVDDLREQNGQSDKKERERRNKKFVESLSRG